MPRPRSLRAALGAVAAGAAAATSWGAVGPAAAAEPDPDPLLLDITRVSPATVPSGAKAQVRIVGTVTNMSTSPFTRINVQPVTSDSPITAASSLAAAAETDADTYVGDRITTPGAFDTIDVLEPGATAEFRIKVSPDVLQLGSGSGVYWLGVHAIGDGETPRDEFADGRARTFIPSLPAGSGTGPRRESEQVPGVIVAPLRADIRHAADGSLLFPRAWARSLSEGGRLHDLLDVAEASDGAEITWLVDPAVPQAVARLVAGNPPRSLAPPSGEEEIAPAPDGEETDSEETDELTTAEERAARVAEDWLDEFSTLMADADVLALPFGDVDVSAAAAHDPAAYGRAVRRGEEVLDSLGVPSTPAVAPPGGRLSPDAVTLAPSDAVVLMSDMAFESAPQSPSGVVDVDGRDVVVTSSGAAQGGPGPGDRFSPLALRQRMLSEASLRLLGGDRSPLVTVLPSDWHPDHASPLFLTRSVPWYRPQTLTDLISEAAGGTSPEAPAVSYTQRDRGRELPASAFTAATAMVQPALLLDGILTDGSTLPRQVGDEALTTLSHAARELPARTQVRADAARREIAGLLEEVTIEAPPSATLSSTSGSIGTTVVNGLDQSVTVRVDTITDSDLETIDDKVVELAPLSRTPLILEVATERIGIHDVRLVVTDADGRRLGSSAELPIRAAQVSTIIWYIMGGGALLLFSAIGVRIVRRIRGESA